jgi:hypothetical protein
MSQQKLTAIQRAITELHSFVSPDNSEGLVLIQTNGNVVSVFTNEKYKWRTTDLFDSLGFEPIVTCADIYGSEYSVSSLAHKVREFESKTQYNAILEKAKSAGLTDDEIQVLQQGK